MSRHTNVAAAKETVALCGGWWWRGVLDLCSGWCARLAHGISAMHVGEIDWECVVVMELADGRRMLGIAKGEATRACCGC